MARLDKIIDHVFISGGAELHLETGAGILLKPRTGASKLLVKQPLSTAQIIGALSEIVPEDVRVGFPEPGDTRFPYRSSGGAVMVHVISTDDEIRAIFTAWAPPAGMKAAEPEPEPEPDPELELASPAEMLELATQQIAGARPAKAPGKELKPPAVEPKAVESKPPAVEPLRPAPMRDAPKPALSLVAAPASPAAAELSGDPRALLDALLSEMLRRRASDLHLSTDCPPMFRVDGDMVPFPDWGELSHPQLQAMLWSIAPERNRAQWEELRDTDWAHETEEARFRVNVFADRRGIGAVLRQIPSRIKSAEELGLSKQILELCFLSKGLVLVTGPTGSGKSTTLAAMIDFINRNREDHIITIEDPIEFVHPNKKCLVNQREIATHTMSFKNALRAALREDPDVVLVGEMRDLETIAIAIETAETGHLVFGTLHTNTAASTVDRIIDQFPSDRQEQVRTMLSESLKAVISQTLCKKIGGGRVPALEVLLCNSGVSNLIREGKTFQIPSIMQTGKSHGMQTMNDALFDLVKRKVVEPKDAYVKSIHKPEFKQMLERAGFKLELPGA